MTEKNEIVLMNFTGVYKEQEFYPGAAATVTGKLRKYWKRKLQICR